MLYHGQNATKIPESLSGTLTSDDVLYESEYTKDSNLSGKGIEIAVSIKNNVKLAAQQKASELGDTVQTGSASDGSGEY